MTGKKGTTEHKIIFYEIKGNITMGVVGRSKINSEGHSFKTIHICVLSHGSACERKSDFFAPPRLGGCWATPNVMVGASVLGLPYEYAVVATLAAIPTIASG